MNPQKQTDEKIIEECPECKKVSKLTRFHEGSYRCENCGAYLGLYSSEELNKDREEAIKSERARINKLIDEWSDIVWEGDTITPRDCVGNNTIHKLKSKIKGKNKE